MNRTEEFFHSLDRKWEPHAGEKLTLKIIGSAAIFLQTGYERGTKDSDILETSQISPEVSKLLLNIAGQGSALHKKFQIYLDIVNRGILFLPAEPLFHALILTNGLKHFDIKVLDLTQVALSKLKRFGSFDVEDIKYLAGKNYISHEHLIEGVRQAVNHWSMDARADDLPKYIENLHTVEREYLFVAESEIVLPHWI